MSPAENQGVLASNTLINSRTKRSVLKPALVPLGQIISLPHTSVSLHEIGLDGPKSHLRQILPLPPNPL